MTEFGLRAEIATAVFAGLRGWWGRTVEDACPYNTVAWLKVGFGAIVARFFTALTLRSE